MQQLDYWSPDFAYACQRVQTRCWLVLDAAQSLLPVVSPNFAQMTGESCPMGFESIPCCSSSKTHWPEELNAV
jgi:hypothetical protein